MKLKVLFVAILLLTISLSFAQELGKMGLNLSIGSSSSIGVTYFMADKFAVRPSIQFLKSDQDRGARYFAANEVIIATSETKIMNVGGSIGGLYYIKRSEPLCSYIGGSVGYTHNTSTNPEFEFDSETKSITITKTEGIQNRYDLDVLFGLEYFLKKRFSIFSEIQFGCNYMDNTAYTSPYYGDTKLERTDFRLSQLGVGISLYIF